MIKLTFCLRRLSSMTRAEFQNHWRENHAPLVEKHKDALRFCRYAQIHTFEDDLGQALAEVRGAPAPYDGVAEMYWENRADLDAAMTSAEGRAAGRELLADEKLFIDLAASPVWLGEEEISLRK
jgi:uncharacterized protein (TIGR02118 family)